MWHALLFLQVTQPPISCPKISGFCINIKTKISKWRWYIDIRSNSHNEHVWINQEPKRKVGMRDGLMCDCGVKLTNTRGVANFALSATIGEEQDFGLHGVYARSESKA